MLGLALESPEQNLGQTNSSDALEEPMKPQPAMQIINGVDVSKLQERLKP
jgi:hypothetical protein